MGQQCGDKTAYRTKYYAEKVLGIMWKNAVNTKKRSLPCRTYKCNICKRWHLTSKAIKKESK